MHIWHWHTWQGLPYLSCSLLQPWAHGFFTQQFSPLPPLELVAALQPQAKTYRVKQVHGNVVLTTSEFDQLFNSLVDASEQAATSEQKNNFPDADGLVTQQAEQAVWVASADCVPALIGDERTGQVAAVHAGWRGTAAAIVPQAIARLQAQGSRRGDLRIALGPAIDGEVYQVSTVVAAEVGATVAPELRHDTDALLDKLRQLSDPPILEDEQPGRVRLDVRRMNVLQLERLGIGVDQIAIAPYCTYRDSQYFFSYRRDQLKKVQWSGIVSH